MFNHIDKVHPRLFEKIVYNREHKPNTVQKYYSGGYVSPVPTRQFFIGLNLSGLENSSPAPPTTAQVSYLSNFGFRIYRLPINWNSIQPTVFGPLDPTYVATLHSTLVIFASLGVQCVLDIHNFGHGPGGFSVGSTEVPISAFVDLWERIVAEFGSSAGLYGIDLMNEWTNGFNSTVAQQAQQSVISAVRASPYNYTGWIYCEGVNFTGAWNWVSGQGQSFNNSGMVFVDPLQRTKLEAHCYLDRDNSGSHFSYTIESTTPGVAPPPISTNPTIGVTRITPWAQWLDQNNQIGNLGEMGSSSDSYSRGGTLNFAAWNTALDNAIAFCQSNNIEFWYWGAGSGFGAGFLSASPGYPFNPEPFSSVDLITKDYSTAGVQAPQMAILRRYADDISAQPVAYSLAPPLSVTSSGNPEAPNVAPIYYGTSGVASSPFVIYYGGKITSSVTVTPHAKLMSGADAGGTFTPSSIVLSPGENALSTFTYTPSQQATIQISTTNNASWFDPPALGFSSISSDPYAALPSNTLSNIYGLYNRFTPNIQPSLLLQRSTDGQMLNWSMTLPNSLGQLGFDRAAIQTWAASSTGINIIRLYDQSPAKNNLTFNFATNLVGSISGTTLSLTSAPVAPAVGQYLVDNSFKIAPGTTIVSGSGSTWTVNISQNVASEAMQSVNQNGTFPTLTLNNTAGYPEIVCTAGVKGDFSTPINGQSALSVIARINQTGGATFFRIDQITGPLYWSTSNFQVFNTAWFGGTPFGSPPTAVQVSSSNLNVTNGTYGDYGFVYNANSASGNTTYKNGSVTVSSTSVNASFTGSSGLGNTLVTTSVTGTINITDTVFGAGVPTNTVILGQLSGTTGGAGTYQLSSPITSSGDSLTSSYVMYPAFGQGNVHFNYFAPGGQNWSGSFTNLEFEQGIALNSTQVSGIMSMDSTYYSTVLPDTLPALPPHIVGSVTGQTIFPSMYTNIFPFLSGTGGNSSTAPGIVITDTNSGTPTDSITITLSGAAGTLSGSGITGTGPYSIAAGTAASVSATLRGALFTPSTSTIGNTTTFTILVTSSAGTTASVTPSVVITSYQAETPLSVPANSFTGINTFGVNLSGGEFTSNPPVGIFPGNFQSDYFATKGFGLIRLPFTSNFLQTTAFGLLNSTYVSLIKSRVDHCLANNQWVILDPHDFGNVWNSRYGVQIDASANNGSDLFQDEWRRLATLFKNYPNVWFGLMNEPTQGSATAWRDGGVIPAVTAIRAVGATQRITIPGIGFASARDFVSNGSAAAFTGFSADSLNNFIFEGHQYLDAGNSGGSPIATQNGSTVLVAMTAWLVANSYQALLGEFGIAPDPFHPLDLGAHILSWDSAQAPITTNCLTANANLLAYMKTNRAQWTAWTAWTGGSYAQIPSSPPGQSAYGFNLIPLIDGSGTGFIVPTVDQQQMATLVAGL